MPGKEWTIPSKPKNRDVLLLFLRAPEAGQVKTRLARDLGDEKTLALYKTFVGAALEASTAWSDKAGSREVWIAFCPGNRQDMVENWLGSAYEYLAQSGADLGQRMARALSDAFDRGAERAVVLGTDIPQIRPDHIERAFECLHSADVVIGPSLDGGYWLIGTSREGFSPRLFHAMDWGTPSVFADTIDRCRALNLTWSELEPLQDVDTLADLTSIKFPKNKAMHRPGSCDIGLLLDKSR